MAPRITHDTLIGLIEGSAPGGQRLATYAEPVSNVPQVATEVMNTKWWVRNTMRNGTLAMVLLGTLVFGTYIHSVGP